MTYLWLAFVLAILLVATLFMALRERFRLEAEIRAQTYLLRNAQGAIREGMTMIRDTSPAWYRMNNVLRLITQHVGQPPPAPPVKSSHHDHGRAMDLHKPLGRTTPQRSNAELVKAPGPLAFTDTIPGDESEEPGR